MAAQLMYLRIAVLTLLTNSNQIHVICLLHIDAILFRSQAVSHRQPVCFPGAHNPSAAVLITFKMESGTTFQMQAKNTMLSVPTCRDPQNNCQGCKFDSA